MLSTKKTESILKKMDYLTWRMVNDLSEEEKKRWLKGVFYNLVGYMPNLESPKSYNEKMCWYRMNYFHPDIPKAVDKVDFKEYIREILGDGYTAKLFGVYTSEDQINFDELPEAFALKSTLSSSANNIIFVKDKNLLDRDNALYQASEWLQPWNSSARSFSNWYKGMKPRILAEELLEPSSGNLLDYKFFCFGGQPEYLMVIGNRFSNSFGNYYDLNWNQLPIENKFKNSSFQVEKPKNFGQMIEVSKVLSSKFPFVRVDFYEVDGRLLIGELTFSSGGGFEPFEPREWDYIFGEKFHLPQIETQVTE